MFRHLLQQVAPKQRLQTISEKNVTVLAWGRNTEGQCGLADKAVVSEPVVVRNLDSNQVSSVAAGRVHSAAVLKTGEVLSWGCGKAGKLGHGNTDNFSLPTTVEALSGRSSIKAVALGAQHTLFLDSKGAVYSCGENKEGQCGYGTSIDVLAQQRRQEWAIGANVGRIASSTANSSLGMDGHGHGHSSEQHSSQRQQQSAWFSGQVLKPFIERDARQAELEDARRLWEISRQERARSSRLASSSSYEPDFGNSRGSSRSQQWDSALFGPTGLLPGQSHTPTRIGRDLHELVMDTDPAADSKPGIQTEVVRAVAASRYFSMLASAQGEVWTFGGGFNGELGFASSSWVTSAQKVEGELAKALQEGGGAIALEAGGTFCMALTAQGKVIVWGRIGGPGGPRGSQGGSRGIHPPMVAEVRGLPPIISLAAGQSHGLLTDGERVWAIGRWLDADGSKQMGSAWQQPEEVLRLPQGVRSVAAGMHSSAAISRDGQLWLWGKVISKEHARHLNKQGSSSSQPGEEGTPWTGLGSDHPAQVEGLRKVQAVSLGGVHAMAVVDDED